MFHSFGPFVILIGFLSEGNHMMLGVLIDSQHHFDCDHGMVVLVFLCFI